MSIRRRWRAFLTAVLAPWASEIFREADSQRRPYAVRFGRLVVYVRGRYHGTDPYSLIRAGIMVNLDGRSRRADWLGWRLPLLWRLSYARRRRPTAAAALALFALLAALAAPPADARWLGRLKAGAAAVATEGQATRAWVTLEPQRRADGRYSTIVISLAGSDPSRPAALVVFSASDASHMGKLVPGTMVTLRKFTPVEGGPLPILRVEPKSTSGWRHRWMPRFSDTMGAWGHAMAGLAASSGDGSLYDEFFENRPGARAQFEARANQVRRAMAGGESACPGFQCCEQSLRDAAVIFEGAQRDLRDEDYVGATLLVRRGVNLTRTYFDD